MLANTHSQLLTSVVATLAGIRPVTPGPSRVDTAKAVRDAIAEQITTLPEQLRRSLTWDQGAEMAQHAQLRTDVGMAIYFCEPHSPWQRPSNENTVSIGDGSVGLLSQAGAGSSR